MAEDYSQAGESFDLLEFHLQEADPDPEEDMEYGKRNKRVLQELAKKENQLPVKIVKKARLENDESATPEGVTKKKEKAKETAGSYKAKKGSKRSSFFRAKSTNKTKKSKLEPEKEVTISVGILTSKETVKRGENLPLKILPSATDKDILVASIAKHRAFNKRFDSKAEYRLVYKDGSEVKSIPGTSPLEPFTLNQYKEESGFGYARIIFYLLPTRDIFEELNDILTESLRSSITDIDSDPEGAIQGQGDLKEEIANLATNVKEDEIRVTVRRKHLWWVFTRARNEYFCPTNTIKVTFCEMLEYCETRLFPDGFPTESVLAVARDDFLLTAGEVMAMSIVQGGPCPNFLHQKFIMCSAGHL
ncbi:uncharacterized protein [Montipora foliosa]|uniref:uncharacterized protein n=1 Tax=Montipora foliosa TaxID=591990 RepID=UPI0035F1E745